MCERLTDRDRRIAAAIRRHQIASGEPPTIGQIQRAAAVASRDSLYRALARLVAAGVLVHLPGRWRCYADRNVSERLAARATSRLDPCP